MSEAVSAEKSPVVMSRQIALQVLFAWEAAGDASEIAAQRIAVSVATDADSRDQSRGTEMASGAWSYRADADKLIDSLSPQWPTRRQPAVDRNILRLAVWELHHAATPPKVVIDQAIELAKEFSTAQSPAFVNGVLDAALKQLNKLRGT